MTFVPKHGTPVLLVGLREAESLVYYVGSERSKVFHTKARCGSTTCGLTYNHPTLPPHLRPCKRCDFPENLDQSNETSLTFECLDLGKGQVFFLDLDRESAELVCSCPAFEEGELCLHLRFVMNQVLGLHKWGDILYEYGGFDEDQGEGFLKDLDEWLATREERKRRCFACQTYVSGLHAIQDPVHDRIYHQDCFSLIDANLSRLK